MNSHHALRRAVVACAALLALALATAGSASAGSIVYIKDHNVWVSSPDGAVQQQVTKQGTADTPFRSPSQRDDGVIVSPGPEKLFWLYNHDGSSAGGPWLQPTCGGLGYSANNSQVRPAGGLILYDYIYTDCFLPFDELHLRTTVVGDNAPTINESIFPHYRNYGSSRWIGNDLFAMVSLGGDRIDLEPELPSQQGQGLSPRPWLSFTQPGTDFDSFDVSRTGNNVLLEVTPDTDATGEQAELVVVNAAPAEGATVTPICSLANFAPAGADPRWSPDGTQIAWTGADGVYVSPAPVADGNGNCVIQPKLIAPGAKQADWGTKDLPRPQDPTNQNGQDDGNNGPQGDTVAPVVRLAAKGAKLSRTLGKGYTATVSCNEACSITGQFTYAGKLGKVVPAAKATKVASGKATLTKAGKAKLKLKFTKKARKALKRKRSVKLTLQVTVKDSAGNPSTRTTRVTLKR